MNNSDIGFSADEEMPREKKYICKTCNMQLNSDDNFCRNCGTQRGKGMFNPRENEMSCLYGPPMKQSVVCQKCGYSWEGRGLGGDNARFCPRCGAKELTKSEPKWCDFDEF